MFKVIVFFFRSSWKQIIIISCVSVLAAGLNVLSLKFLKDMVSEDGELFSSLGMVSLFVLGAASITILLEWFSTKYFESKLVSYREELSRRVLKARFEKIESKLPRLAPVLMVEVNELSDFGKLIPTFIVALFQIIAIMIYMFFLSWQLSIIVLSLFLIVIGLMAIVLPTIKKLKDKRSKSRFHLYTILELMNKGFKDLIMNRNHSASYITSSIRPPSVETSEYNAKIHLLKIGVEQMINALLILGFGVAIMLFVTWIKSDQQTAVQFMAMMLFILPSFVKVIDFFNQTKNAENALDQISELDIDLSEVKILESEFVTKPKDKTPFIKLSGIEYSYTDNDHGFHLGPIDLEINENEITFINGGNGSGKSTLFNLIAGLYPPKKGSITIQGNQVNDENIRIFRDQFSCYFTDSPVFDNLDYINKEDFELGEKYIKELDLEGKTNLTATTIAQTNLSFGQRGRLNLLRLLLENRPIYMLDEWAANQDQYFKEKFYKEIIPGLKSKGKTIILISHDERYSDLADKIVSMRNGKIDSINRR